jgi:hypothetical protein
MASLWQGGTFIAPAIAYRSGHADHYAADHATGGDVVTTRTLIACKGALAALSQPATFPADVEAAKTWLQNAIANDTSADLLNACELAVATIERLSRHNSANGTLDVLRSAIAKAKA